MSVDGRYKNNIDCYFSEDDQKLLLNKNISVIGCGGQGGYTLEFLARLGVKSLHFWDGDIFEYSNLNRQNFCSLETLGKNKAEVLRNNLSLINPNIQLFCHPYYFGIEMKKDFKEILDTDIIFNAADVNYNGFELRTILRKAIEYGVPLIDYPMGLAYGYVTIETADSLKHYDCQTRHELKADPNELIGQPAFQCAILAAGAVNQMKQYFCQRDKASVNTVLNIDFLDHKIYGQEIPCSECPEGF